MISDNKMMRRWTLYVVMISLTVAYACNSCTEKATNMTNCKLETLPQLPEYQTIISEISSSLSTMINKLNITFEVMSRHSQSHHPNKNVHRTFCHLGATCKRYTDILAFKDQLQKQLFNNTNPALTNHTIALQLVSLIINLQTAAIKLQDIEMELNKRPCVRFTSEQYEMI